MGNNFILSTTAEESILSIVGKKLDLYSLCRFPYKIESFLKSITHSAIEVCLFKMLHSILGINNES